MRSRVRCPDPVIGVRAVHEHNWRAGPLVEVGAFERSRCCRGHDGSEMRRCSLRARVVSRSSTNTEHETVAVSSSIAVTRARKVISDRRGDSDCLEFSVRRQRETTRCPQWTSPDLTGVVTSAAPRTVEGPFLEQGAGSSIGARAHSPSTRILAPRTTRRADASLPCTDAALLGAAAMARRREALLDPDSRKRISRTSFRTRTELEPYGWVGWSM